MCLAADSYGKNYLSLIRHVSSYSIQSLIFLYYEFWNDLSGFPFFYSRINSVIIPNQKAYYLNALKGTIKLILGVNALV